jgi:antirestriction protein ArdC
MPTPGFPTSSRPISSRLDREFGRKQWGDEGYAREELVAELASAFLCAYLGITPAMREDHASYRPMRCLCNTRRHFPRRKAIEAELIS